ncbi:HHE domain-containing protein [Apiospora arundinis]|uniref:HHE domain-containing protein n=1 Tax=Apiospora arundinis TaxID=335852 RepID=A0ABR2HSL9_9PEZI
MLRTMASPTRTVITRAARRAPRPTLSPVAMGARLYSGRILSNGMISSRTPKPPKAGEKRAVGENWSEHPDDPEFDHGPWHKISEAVKSDHRKIEAYYDRMTKLDDPVYQEEYQNAFVWKLSRHSIAEEIVLYPNLERCVEKGNYIASQDRHEHYKLKRELKRFQKLRPSSPEFMPTLDRLWKELKTHMQEEEAHDLVKLEEAISESKSRAIADSFEYWKGASPTRSHPWVPNTPPWETVVGSLVAPWDRMMDKWRKWPAEDLGRPQQPGAGSPPM